MAALLGAFTTQSVDILAGVVDHICPSQPFESPETGFSVLRGRAASLLPSLWDRGESLSRSNAFPGARIQFALDPLHNKSSSVEVTLPLANTIFQTGQESTLLACNWEASERGFRLSRRQDKSYQRVVCSQTETRGQSDFTVHLIPITPPRKMLACLGNIVTQIEVDGSAIPASTE